MRQMHPAVDEAAIEQVLGEFLALEAVLKPMVKRMGQIKDWCKEQGSFSTESYVVSIKTRQQDRLVGLEAAVLALGLETLEKNGLIQKSDVTLVNISKKG